ncbi:hypothetical protein HD806DRAFT_523678 [Xylariaceae sp. AK1471]|nr:hypothetical protein HD806DRAFT_523678 [Xylariaceae sp. AK1471]
MTCHWYKRQWAWLGHKDTLYFSSHCGKLHYEYVDLLKSARHVILTQRGRKAPMQYLLHPGSCPHLRSIDIVFASLQWPALNDAEFEAGLWGEQQYHLPIQMVKGDAAEGKRVHEDLSKRLGPHLSPRASHLLNQFFTHPGRVRSWNPPDHTQFEDYDEHFSEPWEGTYDDFVLATERLREMAEKSMFRRVWMLSRVPEYKIASIGSTEYN